MRDFNMAGMMPNDRLRLRFNCNRRCCLRRFTLRNQPLNEFNALRTGAQVQAPPVPGYQGSSAAAAPLYQAGSDAGQYQTDLYNANMGTRNAMLSGLFSLGSSAPSRRMGG